MLDALWHIRGGVLIIGDRSEEKILRRFASAFAGHCKPVVRTTESSVEFYDPWWRFFTSGDAHDFSRKEYWKGLSPLGVFDYGKVAISSSERGKILTYEIRNFHGMIFVILGSIALGIFAWAGGMATSSAALLSIFGFLWLYVPGTLWASFRARTFFHEIVANAK